MLYEDFWICFTDVKEADYTEGVSDKTCIRMLSGADA
jgi:hypothetical protein